MNRERPLAVSYCTTCHGRLWQIALTLFGNLRRLRDDEELILVDYGSRDDLGRFVASSPECQDAIADGRLVYARTEAKHYHCPRAKNLAHRLGCGELLVNLDADNSNCGMRRAIDRCFATGRDAVLQMDEGTRGDPLRGTFGRIAIPRYWFHRLGGYDESFAPIGHQDQDLIWRAKAMGLRHLCARTGGPSPVRNTMTEKASHTGQKSWHVMWRANEKASRRNLKEGRLVANLPGWGAADVAINFNEVQPLAAVSPQLISIVLVHRHPSVAQITQLLDRYAAMPAVGEILVVNRNLAFAITPDTSDLKVRVIHTTEEGQAVSRFAAASLAQYPAVLFTSDDVFLPEESLNKLHQAWFADPSMLHAVEPAEFLSFEPEEGDLGIGALTTLGSCIAALTLRARLTDELGEMAPVGSEAILLAFAAGAPKGDEARRHVLPVVRMGEPDIVPKQRKHRNNNAALRTVRRWCRHLVATEKESEFLIEAVPSPAMPIARDEFFAPIAKNSVLFAGPWVGEFGWELCWWNPMIRFLAETFEHVIVAAPESSRYLYEFATEFIPLQTEGWRFAEGKLLSRVPRVCNGSKIFDPMVLWEELGLQECDALRTGETTLTPKRWRALAPASPRSFVADVLCAFRPEKRIGDRVVAGKEYSMDRCAELVQLLMGAGLTVACYGGSDNYCFDGCIDLRGRTLEVQCSALSMAKCAVGPSSGPLHLASLTQCPHVTWSKISEEVAIRYATLWNPFQTPACFITNPDPTPQEVTAEVLQTIAETTNHLSNQALAV